MTGQLTDLETAGPGERDEAGSEAAAAAPATTAWARWRERRRTRVSKWDRPPEPHDWRFFVGNLGKVLIATGILMFGFVAYQLWGTGIETARAQAKLEDAFRQQVEAVTEGEVPEVGVESWELPDELVEEVAGGTDVEAIDPVEREAIAATLLREVELSAVVPEGQDLSEFAVDQDVPIVPGDSFALVEIPEIGVSEYVVPGVKLTDLKRGPGHYPDTPLPGQLGNASIAGHRTTYGAPFFDLDQLAAGDEIVVTMVTGDRFVYRITGLEVVSASDYWVVTTRDPNVAELTLTTCHPKYTARDRLVVHSVLVPEKSAQVGEAEFYQLDDQAPEAIPGDDPTLVADETGTGGELEAVVDPDAATDLTGADDPAAGDDAATDEPTSDEPASDEPASDEPATDQPTTDEPASDEPATDEPATDPSASGDPGAEDPTLGGPDAADEPPPRIDERPEPDPADTAVPANAGHADDPDDLEEIDAFSQGWFDDWDAWPQIALWGIALTIISLLAYQVSKKTRHDSIGFLVGIAPFLVCLYFFFQNVNRLLPPGL